MGDWSDEPHWDDPDPVFFDAGGTHSVTCKFCGEEGLKWEETHKGFILVDEDHDQHFCCENRSTAKQDFA